MEISKMITMSTGHISEETSKILGDENSNLPIAVYNKEKFGWFIYLPTDKTEDAIILKELPKDLAIIFMFARYNMFDIICLDCDGSDIDELPIYDW